MPKQWREDGPGRVFHITSRVNWQFWHLHARQVREVVSRVINEAAHDFDVALFGNVLMSNHFHTVAMSPPSDLYLLHTSRRTACRHLRPWPRWHQKGTVMAQFMRRIRQRTSWFLQQHLSVTGRFWENRYDARPITSPFSLAVRIAYDHRNPVKAEMVARPEDYEWSTARTWATGEPGPFVVHFDQLPFGLDADDLRERVRVYQGLSALDGLQDRLDGEGIAWDSEEGLAAARELLRPFDPPPRRPQRDHAAPHVLS